MLTKENINFTSKKVSCTQKKERKEIPHYGCIPMLLILETGSILLMSYGETLSKFISVLHVVSIGLRFKEFPTLNKR